MRNLLRAAVNRLGYDINKINRSAFALSPHLARLGITVIFDVGANVGQYGTQLRSSGYRGRIVSLEPVRDAFDKLAKVRPDDTNWLRLNLALGQKAGTASINVGVHTEMSSFHPIQSAFKAKNPWATSERSEPVKVETLDSIFPKFAMRTDKAMLKLDVQGYEREVLAGAASSLTSLIAIQTEMTIGSMYDGDTDIIEMIAMLRERGFQLVDLVNGFRDDEGRLMQADGLFERSRGREISL